ncbi:phosphatases II [Karstenula rhodostoma CBS 690.94]|uniref:Phosphatases II n=1 Tax=Karstenula rhodostoma CBS 690.94 TaxID=1392251 RepID=A0A9P4PAQ7_9PLEO|nr:phosphatases II [Karstenula rhodostoma CBS 690.94]
MSYLLHGSTLHTGMGWVDSIPRTKNLYIGGLYALYQTDLIKAAGITHVLSVVDYEPGLDKPHLSGLKKMHIWAEDDPNEDLLQWFERTSKFIREGLEYEDGAVFVHCAMGKSRSAAVVVAYLMTRYGVGAEEGLRWVEEGRPVCEPNPGFKEQLKVWEGILKEGDRAERQKMYGEWKEGGFKGSAWEWEKRVERERGKAML